MKLFIAHAQRVVVTTLVAAVPVFAQEAPPTAVHADAPTEWIVEGEKREALVILPSKPSDGGAPVVFVFHGHGGSMRAMERRGFQQQWPEAIVVCPQGLPTATGRDPEGKRAGWQNRPGTNNDRDLKFVDAILKSLREKHRVDDRRIFATGHSNGGGFTYLLWTARGKELAAIAPVASGAAALRAESDVKPLPVLRVSGERDHIVPLEGQEWIVQSARRINGCDAEGKPWASAGNLAGTIYPSTRGAPVVWVKHPGGHRYPDQATQLIVRFFQEAVQRAKQ